MSDTLLSYTPIFLQYVLETCALAGLASVTVLPAIKRWDTRKALLGLVGLNMLRFGGVAGALAAMAGSKSPAFLVQVALGDGVTALLAAIAFVLLLRKSPSSVSVAMAMNVTGLTGILLSEGWLSALELSGEVLRTGLVHGPTVGAAIFSTVHGLVFYFVARAKSGRASPDEARRRLALASTGIDRDDATRPSDRARLLLRPLVRLRTVVGRQHL